MKVALIFMLEHRSIADMAVKCCNEPYDSTSRLEAQRVYDERRLAEKLDLGVSAEEQQGTYCDHSPKRRGGNIDDFGFTESEMGKMSKSDSDNMRSRASNL